MPKILHRQQLSELVFRLTVEAPEIAAKHKAGKFIILRISEKGERIPLTIADSDADKGTIDLIVQAVGKTTRMLSGMKEGDEILDLLGPLGVPTHIADVKHAVMIGGGVGGAPLYPICKAYKKAGCRITVILGARNESLLVLEKEFTEIADRIIIATDDGSKGIKGQVTTALQQMIDAGETVEEVVAIGPLIMMKFVCKLTKEYDVKTVVSMNPIMIDGTGMCGGCRVIVGGETKFACVDGPDFDGHQVDWDEAIARSRMYRKEEAESLECKACNLQNIELQTKRGGN